MLADGGENFGGDPLSEGLGLRLVGAENDIVKATLVDDGGLLVATRGGN